MRVISVVGYKKTGKTTLVEALVAALKHHGSVGTVKHLHDHSLNTPGTDTWKHANAGADVVIGVTKNELVKFTSNNNDLTHALDELADVGMDFAVVEGFKESRFPKIALGDVEAFDIVLRLDSSDADIKEIVDLVLKLSEYHTLGSLIKKIRKSSKIEESGAIGTFTGIVRRRTGDTHTEYLEFEEYPGLSRQKMDEICDDLLGKKGIIDVLMHHKTGVIPAGDDIVYIVVAAGHRDELFPILREAIERLKAEVPIWKKEHTVKGEWWVHDKEK